MIFVPESFEEKHKFTQLFLQTQIQINLGLTKNMKMNKIIRTDIFKNEYKYKYEYDHTQNVKLKMFMSVQAIKVSNDIHMCHNTQ